MCRFCCVNDRSSSTSSCCCWSDVGLEFSFPIFCFVSFFVACVRFLFVLLRLCVVGWLVRENQSYGVVVEKEMRTELLLLFMVCVCLFMVCVCLCVFVCVCACAIERWSDRLQVTRNICNPKCGICKKMWQIIRFYYHDEM